MASDKIVTITEANFDQEVVKSTVPVLVDFWASWCGPCKMVAPTLDILADELDGKVRVAKLNVDDNRNLAMQFQVQSIPTFILFKDGQPVERKLGLLPKAEFQNLLGRHVAIA